MKKWAAYVLCLFFFALGVGGTYAFMRFAQGGLFGRLFARMSFSYKGEVAVMNSEDVNSQTDSIPFPKISRVSFKGKFVEPAGAAGNAMSISYVAEITVDKLDKKDLPPKFSKTYEEGSAKWQYVIPDDVLYEMSLRIVFLDKEGFQFSSAASPTATIRSGETNTLQDVSADKIPIDVVKRTKSIKPVVVLTRYVRPVYREKAAHD